MTHASTSPVTRDLDLCAACGIERPPHGYLLCNACDDEVRQDWANLERVKNAGPELLAALERAMNWLSSYPGGGTLGPDGPYEQARAAIAQAKGVGQV